MVACIGVCCLCGFAGGLIEGWLYPGPGQGDRVVDPGLGMGFIGLFPGVCWALLERTLEKRGGDTQGVVSAARRRLVVWTVAGVLLSGLLGALVLAGLSALFHQGFQSTGFNSPTPDLFRVAVLGFCGGGLMGAPTGFAAAFLWSILKGGR